MFSFWYLGWMIILFGVLISGSCRALVPAVLSHNLRGILIYYLTGLNVFGIIYAKWCNFFLFLKSLDRSLEPTKSFRSSFCLLELKMEEFITDQGTCAIVEHPVAEPQGWLAIFHFVNISAVFHFKVDSKCSLVELCPCLEHLFSSSQWAWKKEEIKLADLQIKGKIFSF